MSSFIVIEGNIGAGKTTLAEYIVKEFDYKIFREPVDENPYLEKFYNNPIAYALEMQFWLMSRRFLQHQEAIKHVIKTGQGVVMDRSIYGDFVFAKEQFRLGNITEDGFANYLAMRDVMERMLYYPKTVIYLNVKPETCLERINKRSRDCEKQIPIDYLRGLDRGYMELKHWFISKQVEVKNLFWDCELDEVVLKGFLINILQPNFKHYKNLI